MKSLDRSLLVSILLILLAGTLSYANCFDGVFIFDDEAHIVKNPDIRSLWPIWKSMFADINANRPLIGLSLAVNYAMGGYNTFGYHLFNLLIHLVSAVALFGIVYRLCSQQKCAVWCQKLALQIATTAALLWVVHPLNIQAVTYIIQRFQSMMGMFYLLAVYFSILHFESVKRQFRWLILASLCAILSSLCKQDMVTIPVTVLFINRLFFAESFAKAIRENRLLYAGLLLSWVALYFVNQLGQKATFAGFDNPYVTPYNYALTQLLVVTKYIGLALFPLTLCFDYRQGTVVDPSVVVLEGLFMATLLGGTFWLFIKNKLSSIFGVWFFVNLAITSSFFPIADAMCEYRMYLPLGAVAAMVSVGLWKLVGEKKMSSRMVLCNIAILVCALGVKTFSENKVYASQHTLWTAVTKVRPQNPRAWNNLGIDYETRGFVAEARECYRKAYAADPRYAGSLDSLARVSIQDGRNEEALQYLHESIKIVPTFAAPYYRIAEIYTMQNKLDKAEEYFRKAIDLNVNFLEAYNRYGVLLLRAGRAKDAIPLFQRVVVLSPMESDYFFNLGTAQAMSGQTDAGIASLEQSLRLNPEHLSALSNLGTIYMQRAQWSEAKIHLSRLLALNPKDATALQKLQIIEAKMSGMGGASGK